MNVKLSTIIKELETLSNPDKTEKMKRFAIVGDKVYGVSVPSLRFIARRFRRDHNLALELWSVNSRETRILAGLVDDVTLVTNDQLEAWVLDFDSWEICDQCIINLFVNHPLAWEKASEWSRRNEEFVKRAAFTLMAALAVHDKQSPNDRFESLYPYIESESNDNRNFVKKSVNWALRQIGKKNFVLNTSARECARRILETDTPCRRWVARNALMELESEKTLSLIRKRTKPQK